MEGNKGIGVVSAFEEQPIYQSSRFGPFCLATNGIIENEDELAAKPSRKKQPADSVDQQKLW